MNGNYIILIDTEGRIQNHSDLLDELEKIKRVIKKIDFGWNSRTGNSSWKFLEKIGLDCQIITKLDGYVKAGALISLTR